MHYHRRLYDELRHLEAMQFVSLTEGHGLVDIRDKYSTREDIEFDLKEYFRITERARILDSIGRTSAALAIGQEVTRSMG